MGPTQGRSFVFIVVVFKGTASTDTHSASLCMIASVGPHKDYTVLKCYSREWEDYTSVTQNPYSGKILRGERYIFTVKYNDFSHHFIK